MDFTLSRQHEMLRDMVREFAEKEASPQVLEIEEKAEFPHHLTKRMAELGLVGIFVPKAYGGGEMDHLARLISLEELSRVYSALGLILEGTQGAMYALLNEGTEEQRRKYLPPLCRAEKLSCFAVTEPSGGSDLAAMQSLATAQDDYYVLNGRKVFISLSAVADYLLVVTRSPNNYDAFLMERGTPGLEAERRENFLAERCLPVGEIVMTDCRVPKANLVGKEGSGLRTAMACVTVIVRAGLAAISLGLARGAYEGALKFAKERILYGKPIAELQAIQFKLADMEVAIDAARHLTYHAGWLIDQGKSSRELTTPIAKAKLFATDVATRVSLAGTQILGGYGLALEHNMINRLNEALAMVPGGGTSDILRVIIGREIIR
ncbi:MAG TPA: acyl-CoA dehydrogenase [Dehalococcoidia bacterium]|nr:acyl-CoA dehydrogenase [Dehalococcoidia bacterium]